MAEQRQSRIFVLVADDHELTRFSLNLLLSSQKNTEIVGLASNGQEAVELAKRYRPHVVILDLQMPVMDGFSAAAAIKQINPHTQILVYSSLKDPQEVISRTAPVDLYLSKDVPTEKLIESVNQLGRRSRLSS